MRKIITPKLLDEVASKALNSARLRMNHNFHDDLADPINRMLNAFEPGTYVQPHKHENPDKREVFIILRGSLVVVFFDNDGTPNDFVLLDPIKGNFAVEIPPKTWHSVVALESGSVVYEVKDGSYSPLDDKDFASWAPKEGDEDCSAYLESLINRYNGQ